MSSPPPVLLNLGCGAKTSDRPGVVNMDWSVLLRLRHDPLLRWLAPLVLHGERRRRFDRLPRNIRVHDLARGIPYADASVDVAYHSHVLEHLDREVAPRMLREVWRVLKPGGVQRIVVPDLEALCRAYLAQLESCAAGHAPSAMHDESVAALLEQSVRREAAGTRQQRPLRRWIENRLLGDARQRGETHQWMYDRVNLATLLRDVGFREVRQVDFRMSAVADWPAYGLDTDDAGREYRPGSLYIEATK